MQHPTTREGPTFTQLNDVFYNVNDYADLGQVVPTPGADIPYARKVPIGGNYDRFPEGPQNRASSWRHSAIS